MFLLFLCVASVHKQVGAVGGLVDKALRHYARGPGFDPAGGQDFSHPPNVPIARANSCSFRPNHDHRL